METAAVSVENTLGGNPPLSIHIIILISGTQKITRDKRRKKRMEEKKNGEKKKKGNYSTLGQPRQTKYLSREHTIIVIQLRFYKRHLLDPSAHAPPAVFPARSRSSNIIRPIQGIRPSVQHAFRFAGDGRVARFQQMTTRPPRTLLRRWKMSSCRDDIQGLYNKRWFLYRLLFIWSPLFLNQFNSGSRRRRLRSSRGG